MLTPTPEGSTPGKELSPPTTTPSQLCWEWVGALPYIECPGASFQHDTHDGDLDGDTCGEAEPRVTSLWGSAPPSMQLNVVPSEWWGVKSKVGPLPLTCQALGERGDNLLAVMLLEHVCACVRIEDHLHSEKIPPGSPLGDLALWEKQLSLISSASQGLGIPLVPSSWQRKVL